MTHQLPLNPFM